MTAFSNLRGARHLLALAPAGGCAVCHRPVHHPGRHARPCIWTCGNPLCQRRWRAARESDRRTKPRLPTPVRVWKAPLYCAAHGVVSCLPCLMPGLWGAA